MARNRRLNAQNVSTRGSSVPSMLTPYLIVR